MKTRAELQAAATQAQQAIERAIPTDFAFVVIVTGIADERGERSLVGFESNLVSTAAVRVVCQLADAMRGRTS